MNALLQAREDVSGMTLYLASIETATGKEIFRLPCMLCSRMLLNKGIARVVTRGDEMAFRTPKQLYEMHLEGMERCGTG
jgi:deoxycytidylate deaminase